MSEQQRQDRPPRKNGRPQQPGNGGMRFGRGLFGWVLFIGLAVMLFIVLQSKNKNAQDISMSELEAQANAGNIAELVIDGETVRGKLNKSIQVNNLNNVANVRTEVPALQVSSPWYMEWVQSLARKSNNAVLRAENNQNLLV